LTGRQSGFRGLLLGFPHRLVVVELGQVRFGDHGCGCEQVWHHGGASHRAVLPRDLLGLAIAGLGVAGLGIGLVERHLVSSTHTAKGADLSDDRYV